ncbi:hypothetical protein EVAR_24975_1 [Eumeta japonica]|uniref:Uncharacterized protein n=1 Tax=Eumeta variegata TaxID=151549 RepID=A0A4C1XIE3_EUMVA|nr:hypothetical protein EVAR_24975_1 [Eumeta japonica]
MTGKEADMSLYNHVLEPFRRAISTDANAWKDRAVPNKLNFADNNQSLKESINNLIGTKRKSFDTANTTPDKRKKTEPTPSVTPSSPWEAKRLKIDLIAAKAQIAKLEARVNHQHTIRKEMQILFEEEKTSLEEQHKRDERSLSDIEDRLQVVRRREQDLKDELAEVQKTYSDNKLKWDKEKAEFQKQIADLKDQLLEANVSTKDQISEMERDMEELLQAYQGAQSEVEMLKTEIAKLTPKAEQCTTLKNQLDKQTFEVQQLSNKLKELEYEKDSYKDWQQQAKERGGEEGRVGKFRALNCDSAGGHLFPLSAHFLFVNFVFILNDQEANEHVSYEKAGGGPHCISSGDTYTYKVIRNSRVTGVLPAS